MPSWWRRPAVNERRWLMVDVESSGLDAASDRLLAIAGVALAVDWERKRLAVDLADSFEVVLRQEVPSQRANILVHGIGAQRQRMGMAGDQALRAFAAWVGLSPLLAFHAPFDQTLIGRHVRAVPGLELAPPWVDLDHLCAVTHPEVRARSLDDWMAHFGIRCAARHQAAADALAEADLLLRIWPRLAPECACWRDVQKLAAHHRWVARG